MESVERESIEARREGGEESTTSFHHLLCVGVCSCVDICCMLLLRRSRRTTSSTSRSTPAAARLSGCARATIACMHDCMLSNPQMSHFIGMCVCNVNCLIVLIHQLRNDGCHSHARYIHFGPKLQQ